MAEVSLLSEDWRRTKDHSYEPDCPYFRKDERDGTKGDNKVFRLVEEFAEYDISKIVGRERC
jgi:hypothetical protein